MIIFYNMKRRGVVGAIGASFATFSGCIGQGLSPNNSQETTKHQPQTAPYSSKEGTAHIQLRVLDRKMPAPEPSVSADFDCNDTIVTLNGWFRPPSGCHEIALDSFSCTEDSNNCEIAVTSVKSDSSGDTTCEGVNINYEITINLGNNFPESLLVKYIRDSETTDSFDFNNDPCNQSKKHSRI